MAYSALTNRLFVVQQSAGNAYGFSVSLTGFAPEFVCAVGGQTNGAPAIIGTVAATERMLVANSGNDKMWAVGGTGGACDLNQVTSLLVGAAGPATVGPPMSDGGTVYFAYGDTGLAKVSFDSNVGFGMPTKHDLTQVVLGSAALVGNVFYGENKTYHSISPADLTTQAWTAAGAGAMATAVTAPPVVADALVFGAATLSDGHLRGFDAGTGALAVDYAGAGSIGAPSPVAMGSDKVIYFSDSGLNELAAVRYTKPPSASTTLVWRFIGTSVGAGAASLTFAGPGSEPTIDPNGVLYFGADNGNVYALMTDSGGAAVPTGGTNWPRVGFDNCNAGNNSYTNCR